MNAGSGSPVHAHVQKPRLAQVLLAEVVGHLLLVERAPHEGRLVDDLGPCVEPRTVEQIEHVRADDDGLGRVAAEEDGTADRFRLDLHVVVEQLHEVALVALHRLVHRAGEAAGSAEVALRDHLQGLSERFGDGGEGVLVFDAVRALVDEEDAIDHLEHAGARAERLKRVDAVRRLVVGRDSERRLASARRLVVRRPAGAQEVHVLVARDDVEPDPAAVRELRQRDVEGRGRLAGHLGGLEALLHAGSVRPVHEHGRRARGAHLESDLAHGGPVLPVRCRERVEVARE
jgi:hypothetical protein